MRTWFMAAFLSVGLVGDAMALPVLEFGLPERVVAPVGQRFDVPVVIRNTGDEAFTFSPNAGDTSTRNFGVTSIGLGGLAGGFSLGPVDAPSVMGSVNFYDADFAAEFLGVTLNPGDEMSFILATDKLAPPPRYVFSSVLGVEVGVLSLGISWRDSDGQHTRFGSILYLIGGDVAYGDPVFGSRDLGVIYGLRSTIPVPAPTVPLAAMVGLLFVGRAIIKSRRPV